MIPNFPKFKKLELSDYEEVHSYTDLLPPYSDFDFASMWSWDTNGSMMFSILNNNLVVRFADYLSGEPFYSFIGANKVNETVSKLLDLSVLQDIEPKIKLIPEEVASSIDKSIFFVKEDRDNYDYVYKVDDLIEYAGSSLKDQRYLLRYFQRKNSDFDIVELDVSKEVVKEEIGELYQKWEENKGYIADHESKAIKRALEAASFFNFLAIGVRINGKLIAFSLNEKTYTDTVNCLFAKANTEFYGIYSFLMNQYAVLLKKYNIQYINYEQDLGLYNLRKAKTSFGNNLFLKKYSVTKNSL